MEDEAIDPALSVVIPTWNGLSLLQESLPSVVVALEHFRRVLGEDCELIVVDDGGEDATPEWVQEECAQARLIRRPSNGGFSTACNTGIASCRGRVVALLNNDLRVEPDYFVHLYPHFENGSVFAVTARAFEWDPPIFAAGGKVGRFRRGFWSLELNYDVEVNSSNAWIEHRRLLSAYAVGGFACYDRAKLKNLGGFNELLSPFLWEDNDLSYRAWKRGWEIHYEPRSRVRHQISATIDSNYQKHFVKITSIRNRLLFHWINLHSPSYLVRHLMMLALLLSTRFLVLDFGFYRAFFGALHRLRPALACRKRERKKAKRTDVELFDLLQKFYAEAPVRVFRNQEEVIQHHIGPAKLGVQQDGLV